MAIGWNTNETPPVFGSQLNNTTVIASVTTSNPPGSAVSYATLGSVGSPILLDATARYYFIASYVFAASASNTSLWVDLYINGLPSQIQPFIERLGLASAQTTRTNATSFLGSQIGAGAYFDLRFAKSGGTGSVTFKTATLTIYRIV